ncbi:MAG: sulfatase [Deltaproteobacteria bacterium]|nr:sulfatase [Deltaproteobacteria bacterium]
MNKNRRKVLRLLAATPILAGPMAGILSSCGNGSKASGSANTKGEPFGFFRALGSSDPAAIPWEGKFKYYDLLENLSFASLHRQGRLIDFGTTDYFKYVLGGWRSGWGRNFVRDGVAYTHAVGTSSRIFFHWDSREELVAHFRTKRVVSGFFSLYLNDKTIQKVDIPSADWATYSVKLPGEVVKEGMNSMLLRWEKTQQVAGEDLAGAMDYVYLAPATNGNVPEILPTHAALSRSSGDNKAALLLAGGMKLSYWMQIPREEPQLGFVLEIVNRDSKSQPAEMKLEISASSDGQTAVQLLSKNVKTTDAERAQPVAVDLSRLAGKVVRLDIGVVHSSNDKARLALVQPGLYLKSRDLKSAKPEKKAKNVIVVMIDTLRADHTAPYAKTRVKTPAFDKLAESGALFERFSAVEDWTKPSCATILTGLFPDTHQTQTDAIKLPATIRMVSEELKAKGISTGAFIANGYVSDKFGFKKGWDKYVNYIRENKKTDAQYVFGDAISWIKTLEGKPFYAYVHTIDPHVPYSPPQEFIEMYDSAEYKGPVIPIRTAQHLEDIKKGKFSPTQRDKERIEALYDGEISYHDKGFGVFLQQLEQLGILEDTLIVVVSDHGEEFWDHGSVGHGHQIHQELIHVPFLLVWKGIIPEKTRVSDNHDHTCIVPTIFDAMGLEPPAYLEGTSVLARAMGRQEKGPHAGFSTHQGDREAVWTQNWKLIMRGPTKAHLFDLEADPKCQKNIDKRNAITLSYLQMLIGQFQGAPDKARWRSREISRKAVVQVKKEKVQMDKELEKQLKALGYVE